MIRPFTLSDIKPLPNANGREHSLDMVRRYQEAQAKLEAICKEKGIPVPIMVC
jgi:hypothetical protein